jgi:hypothetical protein
VIMTWPVEGFTMWDSIVVEHGRDLTLREFVVRASISDQILDQCNLIDSPYGSELYGAFTDALFLLWRATFPEQAAMEQMTGLEVDMVQHRAANIKGADDKKEEAHLTGPWSGRFMYNSMIPKKQFLDRTMTDLIQEIYRGAPMQLLPKPDEGKHVEIEVMMSKEGVSYVTPRIIYRWG